MTVVGGDPVTGEALEMLLRAAGYNARFLSETPADGLATALAGSGLLVIAPIPGAGHSRTLLDTLLDPDLEVPTLELLPMDAEQQLPGGRALLWPNSIADLKRAVEAALHEDG